MLRVLALGLVLFAGCVAEAGDDPVCEPGKVTSCPCTDGPEATQMCKSDGSGWGACGCSMLEPAQSDPEVSCTTEITDPGAPLCSGPVRTFLLCDMPIISSGVCWRDEALTVFCCKKI